MTQVPKINPDYLKRVAGSAEIHALKESAYARLGLLEGETVVDVGCGPAIDTIALAKIVGHTGRVLGYDGDPGMVEEANRIATQAGFGPNVVHSVADAAALPLPSGVADACYCERVLQHIPWERCQLAVNEMLRVLKPGGRLAIVDSDWGTLSIATADPVLELKVVYEHAMGFANPYSGRYLLSLLRNANVMPTGVKVETKSVQLPYESVAFLLGATLRRAVFANRVTSEEAGRFVSSLIGARDYQIYFAQLTMVLVSARKEAA